MIHVLAFITTQPGKREEVLTAFRANMPACHAEDGCIEYGPAIDAATGTPTKYGDDTFVVIEKWESPAHLAAHAASPEAFLKLPSAHAVHTPPTPPTRS